MCIQTYSINIQIRNLRYSLRHSSRLGPDSLYNLHALAYEVGGFVRQITTFPDLEVVFGMEDLLEDIQRELQLNTPWKVVSYDTTFQLGNFYLSSFAIYRLTIFKGNPVFLLSSSYTRGSLPGHTGLSSSIC